MSTKRFSSMLRGLRRKQSLPAARWERGGQSEDGRGAAQHSTAHCIGSARSVPQCRDVGSERELGNAWVQAPTPSKSYDVNYLHPCRQALGYQVPEEVTASQRSG